MNGVSSPKTRRHAAVNAPGAALAPNDPGDSEILVAMDKLRALNINQNYDLPQIVVCGSQSAGKSSVLESLVQIPFPRGNGTCTRYVTKVTMKKANTPSIEIGIQPGPDRSDSDAARLRKFSLKDDSPGYAANLADFIKKADVEIFGDNAEEKGFPKDILLITVCGPDSRPLQVLDLPGLIAVDRKENQNNVSAIKGLVEKYMEMKSSIILVVAKATDDLETQPVLDLCRRHDPEGRRTLGIITRPDSADRDVKKNLVKIMRDEDRGFGFHHKWHVVRNRSSEEDHLSQAERDEIEEKILSEEPWDRVDRRHRGIGELRERLRELLFTLAKKELPSLRNTFNNRLNVLHTEFQALGGEEFKPNELQQAFEHSIRRLRDAARDHARDGYESNLRHFEGASPVHLRSRIVEQSEVFRDTVVLVGHAWKTQIRPTPADPDGDLGSVYKAHIKDLQAKAAKLMAYGSRKEEIEWAAGVLDRMRGATLPGFLDPKRIQIFFWRMSEGWNGISTEHIKQIYNCCKEYFRLVTPVVFQRDPTSTDATGFSNAKRVTDKFVERYIIPALDKCRKEALQELNRLEQDRLGPPVNVDKRFLKDRRAHREGREFRRVTKAHHELDMPSAADKSSGTMTTRLDQTTYARHAGQHSQEDLVADEAESYLDAMWSHYLIERDIYITNVLRQVIERHFLRHLGEILPKKLTPEKIEELTRKDDKDEIRKKEIKKEMEVLTKSLTALKDIQ